jgi:formate dehydrogenase subunit gamma
VVKFPSVDASTGARTDAPDLALLRQQIETAVAKYAQHDGPLLQILHSVQASLGYIPPAAVPMIATALNLSRADVHGVVTFYHYFRQTPPGTRVVQICQAEACRSMHCEELTQSAKELLGVDFHQTTADGRYTLEPVYCLGNCSCAPSLMIDGELHGRMTEDRLRSVLEIEPGGER